MFVGFVPEVLELENVWWNGYKMGPQELSELRKGGGEQDLDANLYVGTSEITPYPRGYFQSLQWMPASIGSIQLSIYYTFPYSCKTYGKV